MLPVSIDAIIATLPQVNQQKLLTLKNQLCSYIAMDFASKGNLFEYVCFKPLSENAVCFYMR